MGWDYNSLAELFETFQDEQECIEHLEWLRWNGNVVSPFDAGSKVYKCKGNKYRCRNTGKYFNVKTRTLFDNTKISLRKWFAAIWLVTSHKKGISSVQLGRDIGVTQKTAWFMLHRIRKCFCPSEKNRWRQWQRPQTRRNGGNRRDVCRRKEQEPPQGQESGRMPRVKLQRQSPRVRTAWTGREGCRASGLRHEIKHLVPIDIGTH